MMKTREASVKFRATPPALRDSKKTVQSVVFMKYLTLRFSHLISF